MFSKIQLEPAWLNNLQIGHIQGEINVLEW